MPTKQAPAILDILFMPLWVLITCVGDIGMLAPTVGTAWFFQWHTPVATPCEVIGRNSTWVGGRGPHRVWHVTFRYTMDGITYTATDGTSKNFHDQHPEGSETQCYVSPVGHGKAFLQEHFGQLGPEWWQIPLALLPFNVMAIVFIAWWPSLVREQFRKRYRKT